MSNQIPKLCGSDSELANFFVAGEGTPGEAARLVLREVVGYPKEDRHRVARHESTSSRGSSSGSWADVVRGHSGTNGVSYASRTGWSGWGGASYGTTSDASSMDYGRKYLAGNGGCIYIDLSHVELCTPEVTSARDHVGHSHAMFRIARRALEAANAKLAPRRKIALLASNSDGHGHSFGSHLNFLMSRRGFDDLHRKWHRQAVLAAHQLSSIVITGLGKVGAENGAPHVAFQLSQRADFLTSLSAPQTTYDRPLINTRDEPLCGQHAVSAGRGDGSGKARLHVIFYDHNLCHAAGLLKVGTLQILLAMLEVGRAPLAAALDDPLAALEAYSHDVLLEATAPLVDGRNATAVDVQRILLEAASAFVDEGGCEGVVPDAREIVALWADTLERLAAKDYETLSRRLDWPLKLHILLRAMEQNPAFTWDSPEIKMLDHLYSSLDADGLYWAYERTGCLERLLSEDELDRMEQEPPGDTRAYARAMLLRHGATHPIEDVDWDRVDFAARGSNGGFCRRRVVALSDPLAGTKALLAGVDTGSKDALCDALDPEPAPHRAASHALGKDVSPIGSNRGGPG